MTFDEATQALTTVLAANGSTSAFWTILDGISSADDEEARSRALYALETVMHRNAMQDDWMTAALGRLTRVTFCSVSEANREHARDLANRLRLQLVSMV
jgi:hypothetical protein